MSAPSLFTISWLRKSANVLSDSTNKSSIRFAAAFASAMSPFSATEIAPSSISDISPPFFFTVTLPQTENPTSAATKINESISLFMIYRLPL